MLRKAAHVLLAAVANLCIAGPSLSNEQLSPAEWDEVRKLAEEFVAKESPPDVWPFARADRAALRDAERKVFAHFFTPFPLSIEHRPAAEDYYAREFLTRSGEKGKYARAGGYLRQSPLPIPVWDSKHWQDINLAIEILRADLIGLDGFGVDLLEIDGPQTGRVEALYDTAAAVAPSFKIVAEPDMSSFKDISEAQLVTLLVPLLSRPAAYRLADGRRLVVPFMPESKPPEFWRTVIGDLAARGLPIALVPDFVSPAGKASFEPFSYGFSYWGLRDPIAATAHPAARVFTDSFGASKALLMAPVAPQDMRPKGPVFWEAHDSTLFRTLWTQALAGQARYVHLITWNDYSEASEIAPSSGTQFVFNDLAAFYTQWFKLGAAPRIVKDAIFYMSRRQIFDPDKTYQPDDLRFRLRGQTNTSNEIEMLAFLTSAATLEIETTGATCRKDAEAGLAVLHCPARSGTPVFRIKRGNATVIEKTSDWPISSHPPLQDPLYAGGSSTRAFVIGPTPPR